MKKRKAVPAPIDIATLREHTQELIHSLGFVIDYCECAIANGQHDWPPQVAEDLGNAVDMAVEVREEACRLERFVYARAVAANKLAAKRTRRTPQTGGAS